jgi:hypothetical protein
MQPHLRHLKDGGRVLRATIEAARIDAAVIGARFWLPDRANYGLSERGTGPKRPIIMKRLEP